MKPSKDLLSRTVEFFISRVGEFNHYDYFVKKLWQKVKGFKDRDEAEVKCFFLSFWLREELGIISCPIGASWSVCPCPDSVFQDYKAEWMPVLLDYEKWVISQR